jgi:pentatricopeptide repeat protein
LEGQEKPNNQNNCSNVSINLKRGKEREQNDTYFTIPDMRAQGIKPDTIVFNYVIQNMARAKHLDDAVRVVDKMLGEGIPPSEGTCRPLVTNLTRGTN